MPGNYARSDADTKDKAVRSAKEGKAEEKNGLVVSGTAPATEIRTKEKNSIAYQNKDIIAKIFGESLKEKSFAAYGLDLPKITGVLPTNLPAIEANELRLDNLFQFEDGSVGLADYESVYDYRDKIKYLGYVVRVLKRNSLVGKMQKKLRMIVIYTGDVLPGHTKPNLNVGCLDFTVEEVFLFNLDGPALEALLTGKLDREEELTEEEQMKFIILPLVYRGKEAKQACVRRLFEKLRRLPAGEKRTFLLSGMLVFADKVIDREDSEYMRRWIKMTQISQLYEEEAQEKVRKAREEERQKHEAAIQALKAENEENLQKLQAEIEKLRAENNKMNRRLNHRFLRGIGNMLGIYHR